MRTQGKVLPRWRLGAADPRMAAGECEEATRGRQRETGRTVVPAVVVAAAAMVKEKVESTRAYKRCFVIVTRRTARGSPLWIY